MLFGVIWMNFLQLKEPKELICLQIPLEQCNPVYGPGVSKIILGSA